MSISKLSDGSSKRPTGGGRSQIDAHGSETEAGDVMTGSVGGQDEQKFREVMVIHRAHREACEVR